MTETAETTVVVPCHDSSATLRRAVGSVVAQTRLPVRLVLVDDASSAAELAIVEAVAEEARQVLPQVDVIALTSNVGPGAARNRGWAMAETPWVSFLDSDDAWHPRKLEVEAPVLAAERPALLGSWFGRSETSEPTWPDLPVPLATEPVTRRELLAHNPFPTPTVTVRSEFGPCFSEGVLCEDYAAWLRLAAYGPLLRIRATLATGFKRAYGEAGLSADVAGMARAERAMFAEARREGSISQPELVAARALLAVRVARRRVRARRRHG